MRNYKDIYAGLDKVRAIKNKRLHFIVLAIVKE